MTPFLAAFLMAWLSAAAYGESSPGLGPYDAELRQAEWLGREIHELEQAQQVAAEAARRVRGFRRDREVRGALATRVGDSFEVDFAGRDPQGQWVARYRATVGPEGRVRGAAERLPEPVLLEPERARRFDARERALAYPFARCPGDVSVVVVSEADQDNDTSLLRAYLLAASARKSIAVGGNFRMDLAGDGSIQATRGFTNTCIQLSDDPRAVALSLTHLLDPHPTEIHVLTSLRSAKSLYVVTTPNRSMWSLSNGSVRFVQALSAEGAGD